MSHRAHHHVKAMRKQFGAVGDITWLLCWAAGGRTDPWLPCLVVSCVPCSSGKDEDWYRLSDYTSTDEATMTLTRLDPAWFPRVRPTADRETFG